MPLSPPHLSIQPSCVDVLHAVDAPQVKVGMVDGAQTGPTFQPGNLIDALRANAKAALSEITDFPEALMPALIGDSGSDGLALPYLALIAQQPQPVEMAVNDIAQWVAVDFVYVTETVEDGVTDTGQVVRRRLGVLMDRLFGDFHQSATGIARLVIMTDLVSTPLDRQTQYNQFFATQAEPITALSVTMRFLVWESLIG